MVEDAVALYPQVFSITPTSRSASTVVANIRDAIKGAIEFNYPTSLLDGRLADWWSKVVVRQKGKEVLIGPPSEVSLRLDKTTPTTTTGVSVEYQVSSPSEAQDFVTTTELDAFILLLSTNRITGPVRIRGDHSTRALPPNVTATFRDGETLFF